MTVMMTECMVSMHFIDSKMLYSCSNKNNTQMSSLDEKVKRKLCSNRTLCSGGSRISRRWGVDLVGGGVDSRGSYISKILYVKTKESGPLGGRAPGICQCRSATAMLCLC